MQSEAYFELDSDLKKRNTKTYKKHSRSKFTGGARLFNPSLDPPVFFVRNRNYYEIRWGFVFLKPTMNLTSVIASSPVIPHCSLKVNVADHPSKRFLSTSITGAVASLNLAMGLLRYNNSNGSNVRAFGSSFNEI